MKSIRQLLRGLATLAIPVVAVSAIGCSSSVGTAGHGLPAGEITRLLPELPADIPGERSATSTVQESKDGADNWDNSGSVTVDGASLIITSAAGELEWAMYRYVIGLETSVFSTAVELSAAGGDAWVAVAEYGSERWVLYGPYSGNADITLGPGVYFSPNLNYFMCILAYDGAEVTVASTTLAYDNGLAPPPDITGFSPVSAQSGEQVSFSATNVGGEAASWSWDFGGAATPNTSTDASPTVQITGSPGMFTVSVTATNPADSSMFQGSFEVLPPSPVTYLGRMESVFSSNCMPCHSTGSATSGIILDTYWNANENSDDALAKALSDHAPSGMASLTQEEKDDFQAWVDGGLQYGDSVTFTNYVTTVTQTRCSPCHVSGGSSGGVNFDTYANAVSHAQLAWARIRTNAMPKSGGPLTSVQKDKWLAWIEQGTPE